MWSFREMLFLLRWARTYQGACAHVERRDWTSRWEGREVLVSGSLIGGGRRADMRHLLLWPPIGSAAGVWRIWRCPQDLERSLSRVSLSVKNAAFLFFLEVSFFSSCLLYCLMHSKRCTGRKQ